MKSPKETEERLNKIVSAWRKDAPDKTLGGMSLPQFEAEIAPSFTARQNLVDIDSQRARELNARDDADRHSNSKADMVVAGVIGDPVLGPNSSTYEAMGYTRKSERKTGLTRKKEPTPPVK